MSARPPLASVASDDLARQYRIVHGHRRAYRHAGSGPALLFIHGIGDSSDTWLDVLPSLTRDYTVIAPDLLGHGESATPRADYSIPGYANGMRDLLSLLEIDRVTIIGHSLGGGVAAQFAYQFPDMTQRLVLVGTGGVGRGVHPMLRLASAPGVERLLQLLVSAPLRRVVGLLRRPLSAFGGAGLGDDLAFMLAKLQELDTVAARVAFLRTLRSVVDWRGQVVTMLDRAYLTKHLPTLLVWGTDDNVVPSAHAAVAHHALPNSRLEMFEGAAHFPHIDDPRRFVTLLREFITGTRPMIHDPYRWRCLLRDGPQELPAADQDIAAELAAGGS